MKKPILSLLLLASTVMVISCNKNDEAAPETTVKQESAGVSSSVAVESKQQSLFNTINSTESETGYFKINKLENGNAAIEVVLDEAIRIDGAKLKVELVAKDGSTNEDEVFADLGEVNGTTGEGGKNLVTLKTGDSPLKYDDLISMLGFRVRISNGSKIVSEAIMM